ncbi:hypothetical protein NVP1079O_67 [Vibrio phage 1.079.O._10N.286.45.E9]|nr:hypothetical protein NVP1079O_67 [Vibrio phage 1.079.O._10N.286.45.E9]
MNNTQIIKLVIKGLISDGWEIYGDKFIGFKAFKGDVDGFEEFDFNLIYQHGEPGCDDALETFNRECEIVKAGSSDDSELWNLSEIEY